VKWTEKAMKRCKLRVKEITRRNRGQSAEHVIDELRQFANGWMHYFGHAPVVELAAADFQRGPVR
jgi:hypothetical protein